jgi:hypothetical protein
VSEPIDLQINNGRIGFGDENPAPEPERTPKDRTGELVAVMESLADWLDEYGEAYASLPDGEHVAAVWQILELVQVLMAEYEQTRQVVDGFLRTTKMATQMIVDNAGPARGLIR